MISLLCTSCGRQAATQNQLLFVLRTSPFKINQQQLFRLKNFQLRHVNTNTRQGAKSKSSKKTGELKELIFLASPEKYRLATAVGLLAISSGVTMSLPYAVGKIIDIIYNNKEKEKIQKTLVPLCQGLAVIFFIGALANFGRVYLIQTSGQRLVRRLRGKAFQSIMAQEMAFFDKTRTGELVNRLSSDTTVVANSVTTNVSDGLRSGLTAIGSTAMMVYASPKLSMLGMVIIPFVGVMSIPFGRHLKKLSKEVQDSLADATQVAEERISNMRTVRGFGREDHEIKNYNKRIDFVLSKSYAEAQSRAVFFGLTGFVGNTLIISVLYYGGLLVSRGEITVGQLSSFMLYVVFTGASVSGLSSFYSELMKGLGSSTRLFELINRKPYITASEGLRCSDSLSGDIILKNLTFSYPNRPGVNIFTDLSLTVPAGRVTAVVGPSGSGKSTIASLILRLYEADTGEITIGNTEVHKFDADWLRQNIGIVSQEPILFSASIRENLLYGVNDSDSITEERLKEACIEGNAWRFISGFSDGLDTLVGERGIMLSGGQKQRVAIVRALLKNPKVLILDEATSALDSESESLVQEALHKLMVGRTVIVIAHRLSTIRHAHSIAVLSDGMIVEEGSYNELMALSDGHFRNLILKQIDHHHDEMPAVQS